MPNMDDILGVMLVAVGVAMLIIERMPPNEASGATLVERMAPNETSGSTLAELEKNYSDL